MLTLLVLVFVVAYAAIALEHPIKINKSASALLGAGLLWTIYALAGGEPHKVGEELGESVMATAQIVFFLMGAMTIVEVVDAHNGFAVITQRIRTTQLSSLMWLVGFVTFLSLIHIYVLSLPDGQKTPVRIRSMVGLIPLFAVEVITEDVLEGLKGFDGRLKWFLNYRPDLAKLVSRWEQPGQERRRLLSLVRIVRMKALLQKMLDEKEFLSPYGIRALSRYHLDHPYRFECEGAGYEVRYQPGESTSGLFGGNSNWRGPIWMPVNYLLIQSLHRFCLLYTSRCV